MSMCCTLVMATDPCIDHLERYPLEVRPYFSGPRAAYNPGWIARLLGKRPVPADPPVAPVCARCDGDNFDTYDWHCLQFVMTGKDWEFENFAPLDFFVVGGIPVGNEDVSAFKTGTVAELEAALSAVPLDSLRSRFNPEQMREKGIYAVDERPYAEALDDLLTEFVRFREFIRRAVQRQQGLLKHIG